MTRSVFPKVIVQDGQTIPGDCQLICNYNSPDDFEEFKKLRNLEKFGGGDEAPADDEKAAGDGDDEDEDNQSVHYGLSLIACGE